MGSSARPTVRRSHRPAAARGVSAVLAVLGAALLSAAAGAAPAAASPASAPSAAPSRHAQPTPSASRPSRSPRPPSRPAGHRTQTRPAAHRTHTRTPPASGGSCRLHPRTTDLTTTWPQRRLGFQSVWSTTEGSGVLVAVIDTGLDTDNPQLRGIRQRPGINVIGTSGTADCDKHGTEVTAIIAAQPRQSSAFVGVAPQAEILPIKQTNRSNDGSGTSVTLARGIDAAVAAHARVANVSVFIPRPDPRLLAAVRRADRAGMVIVAAVGNDGQGSNRPTWPAAYSTRFHNVIAVSASNQADTVPPFPERGRYVDLAAPGIGYQVPAPGGGFDAVTGTSFAAPYVTGTVALMLSAHPDLRPGQVRARLEATADSPPTVTLPDRRFGYGIVDSALAVTAVVDDARAGAEVARSGTPAPIPAPAAAPPPDRRLQHTALAAGLGLLALALLVVVTAAVFRRRDGARVPAADRLPAAPPARRGSRAR